VVGGGQLARMMGEVAHDVGVQITVLATSPEDAAVATCDAALVGEARDEEALARLASVVDVVTFDHELVDLAQIAELERRVTVRPNAAALAFAVDKAHQRRHLEAAGIAVPRYVIVANGDDPALSVFLASLDGPPVVKSARGGYDGRGVAFPSDVAEAIAAVDEVAGEAVVEERLDLRGELSQVLVRGVTGEVALYPLVTTLQREGMCVETVYPAPADFEDTAADLATRIAELSGVVGILAVELFVTDGRLLVNEVALRPHNSAHWTIEGTATSQFANHLRAVSGQSLGSTAPLADAAVMVNVVGASEPGSIAAASAVPGAHVHDYGKAWRPGRKLGHVTVVGPDVASAHVTAWESARAYGTGTREA
jgi:5-(carboxyamino)imidazole ribonucleotide synthase